MERNYESEKKKTGTSLPTGLQNYTRKQFTDDKKDGTDKSAPRWPDRVRSH